MAKLIRYTHPKDSIEDYHAAIECNKDFGAAHYGLAIAHGDISEYDLAINAMLQARRLGFSIEPDSNIDGIVWISRWQQSAGRTDEAIQTLEENFSTQSNSFPSVAEYLSLLSKASRWNGVISTLKKLGESLPDFLMSDNATDLHRVIRASAQNTKRTDFIKKAYEAASSKARVKENDETVLRIRRALATIYAENEEEDKAIKELEEIVKHEEYLGKQDWYSDEDVNKLCEMYFSAAYPRAEGSREYTRNVAKLKKMEA